MKKSIAALLMTFVLTGCMGHHQMHKKHHADKEIQSNKEKCEYAGEFYTVGAILDMAGEKRRCEDVLSQGVYKWRPM